MKKILSTLREIMDEIKKDIDVYIALQRYMRVTRKNKAG